MLEVCELTHKTMGRFGGGEWVPIGVVGCDGRAWSIAEAVRLRCAGAVAFLYRGEKLDNLMLLPAQKDTDRPINASSGNTGALEGCSEE
jgi:hypothetical protein